MIGKLGWTLTSHLATVGNTGNWNGSCEEAIRNV
jgi:hypothetical protein